MRKKAEIYIDEWEEEQLNKNRKNYTKKQRPVPGWMPEPTRKCDSAKKSKMGSVKAQIIEEDGEFEVHPMIIEESEDSAGIC